MPLFSRKSPSASSAPIPEDDDTAPLAQDTDAMQRFTATGRPYVLFSPYLPHSILLPFSLLLQSSSLPLPIPPA